LCRLFASLLLVSFGLLSEGLAGIEAYFAFVLKVTPLFLKDLCMDLLGTLQFQVFISD
jgi:hypothetical protein